MYNNICGRVCDMQVLLCALCPICKCIYIMCMYVYTHIYIRMCVHPCEYARVASVYGYMCECIMGLPFIPVCFIVCYSDVGLFMLSKPGNKRPGPDSELCPL